MWHLKGEQISSSSSLWSSAWKEGVPEFNLLYWSSLQSAVHLYFQAAEHTASGCARFRRLGSHRDGLIALSLCLSAVWWAKVTRYRGSCSSPSRLYAVLFTLLSSIQLKCHDEILPSQLKWEVIRHVRSVTNHRAIKKWRGGGAGFGKAPCFKKAGNRIGCEGPDLCHGQPGRPGATIISRYFFFFSFPGATLLDGSTWYWLCVELNARLEFPALHHLYTLQAMWTWWWREQTHPLLFRTPVIGFRNLPTAVNELRVFVRSPPVQLRASTLKTQIMYRCSWNHAFGVGDGGCCIRWSFHGMLELWIQRQLNRTSSIAGRRR